MEVIMIEARSYSGIGGYDDIARRAQIERGIYLNQLFRRLFAAIGRWFTRNPAAKGPAYRGPVATAH